MSRTYRRRKEPTPKWIYTRWSWPFSSKRTFIEKHSIEGIKLKAEYHSDKFMTMQQVPKWYKIHFCRRPFRRKEKIAIIQAVKYIDEDIIFPKPVKDAMYYW